MPQARIRVTVKGLRIPRSHKVWNDAYPNDLILQGEVIHHKDEDKKNDSIENLEKMTAFNHKSLHSKESGRKLVEWRKKNPKQFREILRVNWEERRRKGNDTNPNAFGGKEALIARNKARKGEKRTVEQRAKQSKAAERAWEGRRKNA